MLYPLPLDTLKVYMQSLQQLLVVELSYGSQFHSYLRSELNLPKNTVRYKRSGCMPFTVKEIYQKIQELNG